VLIYCITMSEPPTNPESTQNEALTSAKQVAKNALNVTANSINNSLQIVNKATYATTEIATNAIGKTTEVTGSALSIVTKTGKIAEEVADIGLIAVKQSSGHIGNTVGEGAKSLSIIAQTANSILGTVKSIAERTQNAIEDANKRRKLLNEENLEVMKKSSETNIQSNVEKEKIKSEAEISVFRSTSKQASDLEIAKNKAKIDLEIAKINSDLERDLKNLEFERKEAEKKANELKDEFDITQQILGAKQNDEKKNVYIATHNYGYMDSNMKYKGFSKSFLPFYKNYGKVWKIVKITYESSSYVVDFDLPNENDGDKKSVGYYILKDGDGETENKYYLNIHNLVGIKTISGKLIKNKDGKPLDEDTYRIDVEKAWFKIPNRTGGKKTRRHNRRRNRRTNRRVVKN
jgi:hypothetical protein